MGGSGIKMEEPFSSDEDDSLPIYSLKTSVHSNTPFPERDVSSKLASVSAASQRVSEINSLKEIDEKCRTCLEKGSVLDRTEPVIQEHKLKGTGTLHTYSPTVSPSVPDIGLSLIPGVPVFVNPINMITSLSKDQSVKLALLPECLVNTDDGIKDLIVNKFLLLVFQSEPCPLEVLFWLLEISCLSCDYLVKINAFRALMQLMQHKTTSLNTFSCISFINKLLGKLGARFDATENISHDIYVYTQEDQEILQSSVNCIVNFLKVAFSKAQQVMDIEQHIDILFKLMLDPAICNTSVVYSIWTCFDTLVSRVSSTEFEEIQQLLVCYLRTYSTHHLNSAFIVQTLPTTTSRQKQLQHQLARDFLTCSTKQQWMFDVPDHEVAIASVDYYLRLIDINYTELHSVITILAIFLQPPCMLWPSDSKSRVLKKLNCLRTKRLRETVMEAMKVGPVKDLIIRLELNLEQETESRKKQSSLFDYFIDPTP